MRQLETEIAALERKAEKTGRLAVVRLNGTSDIPWENIRFHSPDVCRKVTLFERFPNVRFYDYTKGIGRVLDSCYGDPSAYWPANYSLTFSRSEVTGADHTLSVLECGGNVAVVFAGALPRLYLGHRVLDGDASDYRFEDPRGCIVGLRAKGKAKKDASGFVLDPMGPGCVGSLTNADALAMAIALRKGESLCSAD